MSGLIVRGLSVNAKEKILVAGIDLDVKAGEMVGLIGPNGAGKTTALRGILGLAPAEAAEISMNGQDMRALSPRARARLAAYLPQARDVFWPITAEVLVSLGRYPHGDRALAHSSPVVQASLEAVDAAAFAERDVRTLSGGELARVLLARALAVEAPLLLADEPVAALDPGHQLGAMERLAEAARKSSVLVVMHDLSLAARFCDRLILLDQGRIAAAGPARDVIAAPEMEKVFGVEILRGEIGGVPLVAPGRARGH